MSRRQLEVDVFGVTGGASGWSTHSVQFARALQAHAQVNFRTRKKHAVKLLLSRDGPMLLRGMLRPAAPFGVVIQGMPLVRDRSSRWIVWETTVLPRAQHALCESVAFLWTPSSWGRQNLIANGYAPDRIAVVPEGVDTDFYTPAAGKQPRARFRFLMVGKWEERKNCVGLLRAFTEEFRAGEGVELYLQAHNSYLPGFSLAQRVAACGVSNELHILLGRPCTLVQLRDLYRSADCFVLPTRAEGWGLPILESMACGVPAIVTGYSAPLDYVDASNGYLVEVEKMVDARDPDFDVNTGAWAEPNQRLLRAALREAFENRGELREKGVQARQTALRYTWAASARLARNTIAATEVAGGN